jgi:hypothetical protein
VIAEKTPESFTRVFGTKADGARALFDGLDSLPTPPKFSVLFGSIAAVFGNRGQSDYASANDALESLGADVVGPQRGPVRDRALGSVGADRRTRRHGHPGTDAGLCEARHSPDRPGGGRDGRPARAGLRRRLRRPAVVYTASGW